MAQKSIRYLIKMGLLTVFAVVCMCAPTLAVGTLDVTVPASLPITVDSDGNVVTATDAVITNNGSSGIEISSIQVATANGWTLGSEAEVEAAGVNEKILALSLNGKSCGADGIVAVSDFEEIAAGESMSLRYQASIPPATTSDGGKAAEITIIVNSTAKPIYVTYDANGGTFGENPTNTVAYYVIQNYVKKISKTSNVSEDGSSFSGGYGSNQAKTDVVTIPGATSLEVTITYATEKTSNDWVCVYDGSVTPSKDNYASSISGKLGGTTKTTKTFTVTGDTVQFFFRSNLFLSNYFGYYAEVTGTTIDLVFSPEEYKEPTHNAGYKHFTGWYTDAACTDGNEFDINTVSASQTVYAKYEDRIPTFASSNTWWSQGNPATAKTSITSITLMDSYTPEGSVVESWDASDGKMGTLTAYIEDDGLLDGEGNDAGTYKLTIAGNGYSKINANADSSRMFSDSSSSTCFSAVKNINGLNLMDTSSVTRMNSMFYYCNSLTALDVSGFDTSKVTDMGQMFYDCSNITTLDVSGFNTSKVTDMNRLFDGCSSLTTLDVSGFDTSNVTTMSAMFYGCRSLTTLDVSDFDTSKVTNMQWMFCQCKNFTTLDVSGFDTSLVTDMDSMFSNCEKLTTLDVSGFDTSLVTDMYSMFYFCSSLTTLNVSSFDTSSVKNMSFMFSSCRNLTTLNVSSFDTSSVKNMSFMFSGCRNLTTLDVSSFDTSAITSVDGLINFAALCTSLSDIKLGSNLGQSTNIPSAGIIDASNNKYGMFYVAYPYSSTNKLPTTVTGANDVMKAYDWASDNRALPPVFASSNTWWSQGNPTTAKTSITSITLMDSYTPAGAVVESWDASNGQVGGLTAYIEDDGLLDGEGNDAGTYKLTIAGNGYGTILANANSSYMFSGSSDDTRFTAVKTISGLNLLNTSIVTNMGYMFYHCDKLTTLDVSGFNTSIVTNMGYMFYHCDKLTTLDVSGFNTSKVTNMHSMFYNCRNLTALDVSGFDTSKVTNMGWMFSFCSNLTTLDVSGFDTSTVTDMSYMFYDCSNLTTLDVSGFDTSGVTNTDHMFYDCNNLTTLDVGEFNTSIITNMGFMFYGCRNLTTLDVSKFDTSSVTNMDFMFSNCSGLTTLDVSGFDTSLVTTMNYTFYSCYSLTTLDVSGFDTNSVTNMSGMFGNCRNLAILDVSGFDTRSVTNMSSMFSSCSSLTTLNVSGFDTRSVTNMNSMFSSCSSLTTLNVSGFDTSNVTDMNRLFNGCSSLTTLDVSNFDTNAVTDMKFMFYDCNSLTALDVSGFDTSAVTNMWDMFFGCSNLTTLDVSGFDTSAVTNMMFMFNNCSNLSTIYASNIWSIDSVTNSIDMFSGCNKLVGGNGTVYSSSNPTDATYARIDTPETPGYFTYKAAPASETLSLSFDPDSGSINNYTVQSGIAA